MISEAFQRISRSKHSQHSKQKYQDQRRSDDGHNYNVDEDDDDDEGSDDGSDYDDDDDYYDDDDEPIFTSVAIDELCGALKISSITSLRCGPLVRLPACQRR